MRLRRHGLGRWAVALIALCPWFVRSEPAAADGLLRLVTQTAWVVPGETATLALRAAGVTDAAAVEVAVTLHPAVKSRAELHKTEVGESLRPPIWPRSNTAVPLAEVPAAADGTLTVTVPTRDPKEAADPARATLSQPGIYPLQVELRQIGGGDTVQRFTTHLLAVKAPADGTRLGTAVVLPLSAPPSTGLVASPPGPPDGTSALADAAAGLTSAPAVALTLAPTPEVLSSLAASAPTTGAALVQAAAGRDVLGRTYVPVEVPSLGPAAGALLPEQLEAGREATRAVLGRDPVPGIWLADEPLDAAALAQVVASGSPRLILSQAALGPTGPAVPAPLRPVTVTGGGATATALVADGTLGAHLDGRASPLDQPLAAHHLLADLAAIATLPADQAGSPPDAPLDRGVATVVAPRQFTPTSGFLTELLGGLERSPVLRAVDLPTGFARPLEPAPPPPQPISTTRPRRGATTTLAPSPGRTLLPLPPGGRGIGDLAAEAAVQLSIERQVLADPASASGPLDGLRPPQGGERGAAGAAELRLRRLVATSADLPVEQRRARLQNLIDGSTEELKGLQMPEARTLRLTARTGQLPVGIFNETGRTAKVLLQLESDKLEFPEGNSTQVVLDRRTTTSQVLVRVRASGGFPVKVRLLTPDGSRVLQETVYVVRAATFPGVAIAVSGTAAAFLAVWWARTLLRERRDKARPRPPGGRRKPRGPGKHRAPRRAAARGVDGTR